MKKYFFIYTDESGLTLGVKALTNLTLDYMSMSATNDKGLLLG